MIQVTPSIKTLPVNKFLGFDFHLAVGEDSVEEDFTRRCVLELTLQKQGEAISAQLLVIEDWAGLAHQISQRKRTKRPKSGGVCNFRAGSLFDWELQNRPLHFQNSSLRRGRQLLQIIGRIQKVVAVHRLLHLG